MGLIDEEEESGEGQRRSGGSSKGREKGSSKGRSWLQAELRNTLRASRGVPESGMSRQDTSSLGAFEKRVKLALGSGPVLNPGSSDEIFSRMVEVCRVAWKLRHDEGFDWLRLMDELEVAVDTLCQ